MTKKNMCEIGGKRYVTPSIFGEYCGWNKQKVTAACKDGRIIGASIDSNNKWLIPVDAPKPLDIEQIRELMVATVYAKFDPNYSLDCSDHKKTLALYQYLQKTGYINRLITIVTEYRMKSF